MAATRTCLHMILIRDLMQITLTKQKMINQNKKIKEVYKVKSFCISPGNTTSHKNTKKDRKTTTILQSKRKYCARKNNISKSITIYKFCMSSNHFVSMISVCIRWFLLFYSLHHLRIKRIPFCFPLLLVLFEKDMTVQFIISNPRQRMTLHQK